MATPSASPTTMSPGATTVPPQLIGTLISPGPSLSQPPAQMVRLKAEKARRVKSATSRIAPSTMMPPSRLAAAASHINPPNTALVVLPHVETTTMSPGCATCSALCTIRLSPGRQSAVTARPDSARPVLATIPGSMKLKRPIASATLGLARPRKRSTRSSASRGGPSSTRKPSVALVILPAHDNAGPEPPRGTAPHMRYNHGCPCVRRQPGSSHDPKGSRRRADRREPHAVRGCGDLCPGPGPGLDHLRLEFTDRCREPDRCGEKGRPAADRDARRTGDSHHHAEPGGDAARAASAS